VVDPTGLPRAADQRGRRRVRDGRADIDIGAVER
jgi:hypothetical protein